MSTTNNPNDPGLAKIGPDGMQETYLVLSDEERAKGFVRPVRRSYIHVGRPGPKHELRDLTPEERAEPWAVEYVRFEVYPESESPVTGRWWTQAMLDSIDKGCGVVTTMGQAIAETYARQPNYYGGTYCAGCRSHFPVGADGEFVWADAPAERVGT